MKAFLKYISFPGGVRGNGRVGKDGHYREAIGNEEPDEGFVGME